AVAAVAPTATVSAAAAAGTAATTAGAAARTAATAVSVADQDRDDRSLRRAARGGGLGDATRGAGRVDRRRVDGHVEAGTLEVRGGRAHVGALLVRYLHPLPVRDVVRRFDEVDRRFAHHH